MLEATAAAAAVVVLALLEEASLILAAHGTASLFITNNLLFTLTFSCGKIGTLRCPTIQINPKLPSGPSVSPPP